MAHDLSILSTLPYYILYTILSILSILSIPNSFHCRTLQDIAGQGQRHLNPEREEESGEGVQSSR